jgi:tRNA (adenine22-N1)-methyltransferase
MYSKRINIICSELEYSSSFADIGCDHGFCAEYVLKNGLCRNVIVSDISHKSLNKAIRLLSDYIEKGLCSAVCCSGMDKIDKNCEQVLIAGMGAYEIIEILNKGFIPEKFVFQPMRNTKELRRYLIENHCRIDKDYTFYDEKFYDIIKGGKTEDYNENYSDNELEFGRDNIKYKNNDFIKKLENLIINKKHI